MHKRHIFKRWFLSYIVFIVIALVFILQIYRMYINNYVKEIYKINESFLQQVKTKVDVEFNNIKDLAYSMGLTDDIITLFSIDEEVTLDDRYKLYRAIKQMDIYHTSNSLVKTLGIYLNKPQTLIANDKVYIRDKDLFLEDWNIDSKDLIQLGKREYKRVFTLLPWIIQNEKIDNDILLYLQTLPYTSKNNFATIIVELDKESILTYLGGTLSDNKNIALMNRNNQVLLSTGDKNIFNRFTFEELVRLKGSTIHVDNQEYYVLLEKSMDKNFIYVNFVDADEFLKEPKRIRNNTILLVLLLALVGLLLAYYFAYLQYNPIKAIMKKVSNNQDGVDYKNEYVFINQAIDSALHNQEQLQQKISAQSKTLRNNVLVKILNGRIIGENNINKEFEHFNIPLLDKNYRVIVFQLTEFVFPLKEGSTQDESMISKFVIHNIFKEILGRKYETIYVDFYDHFAFVIQLENNTSSDDRTQLEDLIENAMVSVKENFVIDFIIAISNVYKSVSALSTAYFDSLEAMSYHQLLDDMQTIFYEDIVDSSRTYDYTLEEEHQLINFIQSGQKENAKAILNRVIERHIELSGISLEALQCLMFDLASTLIKTIDSKEGNAILERIHPIKTMMKKKNIHEMKDSLFEILDELCDAKMNVLTSRKINTLTDEVTAFIYSHYTDTQLNVAMIGVHFDMTPAYLTKLYKQDTGDTLLTMINKVRVEKSKALLLRETMTVNKVAQAVGFTYSNSFIRVFRKIEGITPGKYKEIHSS